VAALAPGTRIVVTLKAGERAEWTFKGVGPDSLTLAGDGGREVEIPKPEVDRIETAEIVRDRLRNGALIGAAAGCGSAVLGFLAYAAHVTASGPLWDGEAAPYYVGACLVGTGIGSLIGATVDAGMKGREVIYRAR
jgi:hypothetical protein